MPDSLSPPLGAVQSLSAVEIEYLRRLVEGYSPSAIAAELNLSIAEAKRARETLFAKLGATHTADAVRTAICAGL
jgi:DNA-binding CsgD family transcriptional regulator